MAEPKEYVGQFSPPYRVVQISGVPDTAIYAAGDVLFRNADGEAFLIPCAVLGKNQLADLDFIIVREQAVAGAVIKANIKLRFSRVGGPVDWVPPAANAAFSGPTDMEDALGSFDIVTADYEEWNVGGSIGYAIACVPVTEATRTMLMADESVTDFYTVPTVGSGTPDYPAASLVTIQFMFKQH